MDWPLLLYCRGNLSRSETVNTCYPKELKELKELKIDQFLLSILSAQAKSSPRLHLAYDLRNSEEDNSRRMLIALEQGTILFEAKDGAWEPLAEDGLMR